MASINLKTYGAMMQEYHLHKKQIAEILTTHESMPGNLLPVLHDIQDSLGYIPPLAVADIAEALNQSIAEIHGVISFYHYFRQTPPGKNTIRICRAESCQAMNGKVLENHAKKRLDVDWHETSGDGGFSLEPVYCLGLCASSPSMSVNNEVYGRVTPKRFDEILTTYQGDTE